jgi:hypothetical protein
VAHIHRHTHTTHHHTAGILSEAREKNGTEVCVYTHTYIHTKHA